MQKMQHHPDLGGDEVVAKQLNLAVSILADPAKRAQYDESLGETDMTGDHAAQTPDRPAQAGSKRQASEKKQPSQHDTAYSELPQKARCPFCQSTQADAWAGGTGGYDAPRQCTQCAGALTPIADFSGSRGDKLRRIHRHTQSMPASLWHCWPQADPLDVMVTDFSPAGCAVDCSDELAPRHIVMLRTQLFIATCMVCYCKPSNLSGLSTLGLEFMTMNLSSSPGSFIKTRA